MMFFFSVIFAAAAIAVNIKYFLASVARFDSHEVGADLHSGDPVMIFTILFGRSPVEDSARCKPPPWGSG